MTYYAEWFTNIIRIWHKFRTNLKLQIYMLRYTSCVRLLFPCAVICETTALQYLQKALQNRQ